MSIRLLQLQTRSVGVHPLENVEWSRVWAISHVWDNEGAHDLHVTGCTWSSTAFSHVARFEAMLRRVAEIVSERGGAHIWIDALCIDQKSEDDKREQIPHMVDIFSRSAGTIAFGTLRPDHQFGQLVHTYDDGKKAWVSNWFERVWTYQELQLPKEVLFVSGDRVFTRHEVYLAILMMSPYLSSPHPRLSVQEVINGLSPKSKSNTQRALLQASKRSSSFDVDKVYGVLGAVDGSLRTLRVDYSLPRSEALLNLMYLMSHKDVLDTLTFNTLPQNNGKHDADNWSGMMNLDAPTEHPSYEEDHYYGGNARILRISNIGIVTAVDHAQLWVVKIPKMEATSAAPAAIDRDWTNIQTFTRKLGIGGDFSQVLRGIEYAEAVDRTGRSVKANLSTVSESFAIAPEIRALPSMTGTRRIPQNRLGDVSLFEQEHTVLVCRSKKDLSFHYGISVTQNPDGTWHKVCTASFSQSCVLSDIRGGDLNVVVGR
ncbi:hypothetical protein BS17DRAFT_787875 [Gyrodon lividus]|nr:hypothetical protein BS17DRAFT_787875 [Gyrodon lividus]